MPDKPEKRERQNMNRIEKLMQELSGELSLPKPGTVAHQSLRLGLDHNEPVICSLFDAYRYAVSYDKRWGKKINEDYVASPPYLKWITGIRDLLCMPGAVANERDISTDSKDDGYCESLFWACMKAGGYSEEDI
jgi:hypothetical protein